MRVIHLVHGKANPDGHNGISRVVYHFNKQERAQGIDSEIWAVVDEAQSHFSHRRDEYVTVECFPRVRLPWGKHEIVDRLIAERESIDLVHFHMIWFYDKNIIADALARAGIPYIITTHGTYSKPHAWTGKRRIARLLFERSFLNGAAEIHAITDKEREELRRYGYDGATFLAPNGIAPEEIPAQRDTEFFAGSKYRNRTRLLWIGVKRADKNLDALVAAIAMLPKDVRDALTVSLVGPDHKGTEARIKALAAQLGVDDCIEFLGPVYGPEKYDAIESADLFILPSVNEVFALAMLDAMACAKPCLASHGCGYTPFAEEDFFIGFEPTPEGISAAIQEMFEKRQEWPRMGKNAKSVIDRKLNWDAISRTMIDNYRRIAAG